MDEVKRTAQQLGVAVKIDGYLPRDTAAEELTVAAAKECVTNCIKHADGNEVYIRIAQRGERYDVTITNNGKIPTEPIKEGSGLSTLRRSIESSGGEMHISHNPRFALLITIPAKEKSTLSIVLRQTASFILSAFSVTPLKRKSTATPP